MTALPSYGWHPARACLWQRFGGKGSGSDHSSQNSIKTSKSKPRSGDMMMDFIWSYWVAIMPKRKKQIEKPQKGPEPTGVET